jgi:hypothetical protein
MVTDLTCQEEAIESLDKKSLGAAIAEATKLLGSSVISLASGRNTHWTVADVAAFRPCWLTQRERLSVVQSAGAGTSRLDMSL